MYIIPYHFLLELWLLSPLLLVQTRTLGEPLAGDRTHDKESFPSALRALFLGKLIALSVILPPHE